MKRTLRLALIAVSLAPMFLALVGCKTNAENGALIGAGAGALGGYVIGNEMDKK